jgi:hypothetical protein
MLKVLASLPAVHVDLSAGKACVDAVASTMIALHPITNNETQENLKNWTSMSNAARGQGFKVNITDYVQD